MSSCCFQVLSREQSCRACTRESKPTISCSQPREATALGWTIQQCHSGPCPHTSWELQVPVDSYRGWLLLRQLHGEFQPPRLRVEPVREGEAKLVCLCRGTTPSVNDQLIQNVLVGEGGAHGQHLSLLWGLCHALSSAELAWQTTEGSTRPAGDRACT